MKLALALLLGVASMVTASAPRVGLAPARNHGVERRRHHARLAVRSGGVVPIISRAEHVKLVKREADSSEDCEEEPAKAAVKAATTDDEDCDEEDSTDDAAADEDDCEEDEPTADDDEDCEDEEPAPKSKAKAVPAKADKSPAKSSPSPSPSPQAKQAQQAPKPSPQPKPQRSPEPQQQSQDKPKVKVAAAVSGGTTGIATFFTQDGTEGACGRGKVPDSALVVALCPAQFRAACGKPIRITNTKTGQTATAIGNDECPECPCDHIDLSIGAWDALGSPQSLGVAPIKFTIG